MNPFRKQLRAPRATSAGPLFRGSSGIVTAMLTLAATAPLLHAAELAPANGTWHAHTLSDAVGYMLLFAGLGIAIAIIGFKVFDKCTPGDLGKEIIENKNVAAAIVAAAIILGVCIIVAAAMIG